MSGEGLPAGWAEVRIADVCAVNPRDHHLGDEVEVTFVPMASVSEVTGTIERPEVRKTEQVKKGFTSFIDEDVIFAKITPCMENGKSAVARGLRNGRGYGSTEFVVLRSKGGVNPSFLHRFVRQEAYRREARGTMQSGVGQARVPKDFIENTTLTLPPLPEQKRIVARLDALQARSRAAREALADVPALLDTFRQSVLAAAFRGDLTAEWRAKNPHVEPASKLLERIRAERKRRWEAANPKNKYVEPEQVNVSELPELPEGWCWTTIETVGDIVNGRQRAAPMPGRRSTPYLRIANIQDDYIDFSDLNEMDHHPAAAITYDLRGGDILVSGGQSLQKVGQSAMFDEGMPAVGFQKNLFRFRGSASLPVPRFAQLVFRAWVLTGVFRQRASITTNLAYMTTTKFAQCPFPLPPAPEQRALVALAGAALNAVDVTSGAVQELAADLNTLDQSILARAFRGELVEQDPNDESASELLYRLRAAACGHAPRRGHPRG